MGCVSGLVEKDPRDNSETSRAALSFMEDDTHREGLSTPVPRDPDAGQEGLAEMATVWETLAPGAGGPVLARPKHRGIF